MNITITYREALNIIWEINKERMGDLISDYSKLNESVRNIIDSNIYDKNKEITKLFIDFTVKYNFNSHFMRKCGFYKWNMQEYLTITP